MQTLSPSREQFETLKNKFNQLLTCTPDQRENKTTELKQAIVDVFFKGQEQNVGDEKFTGYENKDFCQWWGQIIYHTLERDPEIINAPFTLASSQFLLCFFYSLPFMFIFENPTIEGISKEIFELLYVGVMSSGIAYTLQVFGQRYVKPSTAAITFSLEGVFGSLAAWVILSQFLTNVQIFGCFLILIGVLVAQLLPLINKEAALNRFYSE